MSWSPPKDATRTHGVQRLSGDCDTRLMCPRPENLTVRAVRRFHALFVPLLQVTRDAFGEREPPIDCAQASGRFSRSWRGRRRHAVTTRPRSSPGRAGSPAYRMICPSFGGDPRRLSERGRPPTPWGRAGGFPRSPRHPFTGLSSGVLPSPHRRLGTYAAGAFAYPPRGASGPRPPAANGDQMGERDSLGVGVQHGLGALRGDSGRGSRRSGWRREPPPATAA